MNLLALSRSVRAAAKLVKMEIKRFILWRQLAERNPGADISGGIVICGKPDEISIGSGSVLEAGVTLDMRQGGKIRLGANTTIRRGAVLAPYGGHIQMGRECGINHFTIIYGHGGFEAGDLVRFAAHCLVVPANHGILSNGVPIYKQTLTKIGIRLGNDVWVGAGAKVLDGVTIGDGVVVGAGAVVCSDVPSGLIVGGVPARSIRPR